MTVISETLVPDIFFLPEWGQAYASQDHGQVEVFELKNEYGHIFYQFVVRPIPFKLNGIQYFDTITPFGTGGPIILNCQPGKRSKLTALFDEEFQKFCSECQIITEYIRFNPWLKNKDDFNETYSFDKRGITMYIDLTVNDYFKDEFESKARQQVRRAQKNEIELEYDYTGATLSEFSRIYDIMAKRNNIPSYYMFSEEFLKNSFRFLEGKQFIIHAKHEGRYISTAFFLHQGDYLHYHLAANDPEYFHLAANSLILDEACRWGVKHQKKELHLGGASSEPLSRFKKRFTKTDPLDIITGKKVRDSEIYNQLIRARKEQGDIEDLSYFPLYRA